MNELLGRSQWAPIIFGCAAPDTGNAEIIAAYGTPEQKEKWLQPLLDGEVFSCYSMTEPHGGSDPTQFKCRAERDGDEWVINGDKFFSSNLRTASFIIVMCVTNPDVQRLPGHVDDPRAVRHARVSACSRTSGTWARGSARGMHAHVRYENVRVPYENVLGGEGKAFEVAQRRLGGGRIHHAMRTVAACQRYFEMMCERALSRTTKGTLLADKQMVQEQIAESWIEMQEFRLLVLYTAWLIDNTSARQVRHYVSACKVRAAQIMSSIGSRATHLHGALGVSNLMPLGGNGEMMATVDGPTEVHLVTVARQVIKEHKPSEDNWPTQFRPRRLLESRRAFDQIVSRRLDPAAQEELSALVQHGQANDEAVKRFEEYLELTANS